MQEIVADLRTPGRCGRSSLDELADIVWAANCPDDGLLTGLWGWTALRFEHFLVDSWCRLPLTEPTEREPESSGCGPRRRARGSAG